LLPIIIIGTAVSKRPYGDNMSNGNLTTLASKYFAGVPVSQSSQGCSGSADDFISDLFPGIALSPVDEPDGSVSYYDTDGNLLAVIDEEGNVFADIDGEIVIYEAHTAEVEDEGKISDKDEMCVADEVAESSEANLDPKAMVCEAKGDYFDPDGEMSIPPEMRAPSATENAARNLFGKLGDFVGDMLTPEESKEMEETESFLDEMGDMFGKVVDGLGDAAEAVAEAVEEAVDEYLASSDDKKKAPQNPAATEAVENTSVDDVEADESSDAEFSITSASDDEKNSSGAGAGDVATETMAASENAAAAEPEDVAGAGGYETADPVFADIETDAAVHYDALMNEITRSGASVSDATLSSTTGGVPSVVNSEGTAFDPIVAGAAAALGVNLGQGVEEAMFTDGAAASKGMFVSEASAGQPDSRKVTAGDMEIADLSHSEAAPRSARRKGRASGSSYLRGGMRSAFSGLGMLVGGAVSQHDDPSLIADIVKGFGGMPPTHMVRVVGAGLALAVNGELQELAVKEPTHQGNPSDHNEGEGDGRGRDGESEGDEEDGDEDRAVNFS